MFNFRNGTSLAVQQDQYLQLYKSNGRLTSQQITEMERNLWVSTAAKMAPGNLVVRQWALIDLFKNTFSNKNQIYNIMNVLSYRESSDKRIWAEGYSYFNYTMAVVDEWIRKFGSNVLDVSQLVEKIKLGFIATAYPRGGVLYPAPFGDLRNEPLSQDLQIQRRIATITVSNITLNYNNGNIRYGIIGRPIGLNVHIPKDNYTVDVNNGVPSGFKFYEGYNKKYKNSWDEFKDTFSPKRLASVPG